MFGGIIFAVKLGGFDFSTILDKNENCKLLIGSKQYIAPEIVDEQPYDFGVDVWSLLVVIHILLVGNLPFYGIENEPNYDDNQQD